MNKILPTLVALLALAACRSTEIHTDYDPEYDFTGKQTYGWRAGVPADSELNERRIVKCVEQALAERGLGPVTEGEPDLWVSTEVTTRQELRSSGGNVGVGMSRYGGSGSFGVGVSSSAQTYEVTVGSLVIEIRDGPSEQVVWRAVAKETITDDTEQVSQAIADAVQAALEDYPPKA